MKLKMYDKVKLKDGREATIVEIYEQGKAYEADILVDDTGEYPEYETETIKQEDIISQKWKKLAFAKYNIIIEVEKR